MIQVRYAKSALENEEGLNYLWIQLAPLGLVEKACIRLSFPAGIHRTRNLNGAAEDSTGGIPLLHPQASNDLYIEMYTGEPVPCGNYSITLELTYQDATGTVISIKQSIPLQVVSEEESDEITTDDEVVRRISELHGFSSVQLSEYIEYTPAKLIRLDSGQLSEWEKRYRVEGILGR